MFRTTILLIAALASTVIGETNTEIPDLKLNDRSVFQYLGKAHFQQQLNSEGKLWLLDFKTRPRHNKENPIWVDASYSITNNPEKLIKMQFVKKETSWEFLRELKSNQFFLAHPVIPFDGKTFDEKGETITRAIDYLTAVAFEADFQKKFPDKGCWVWIGSCFSYNKKSSIGRNRVNFKFGQKEKRISWDYLMKIINNQWTIVRRLKDNERVNTKTGQVETFVALSGKILSEAVVNGDEELVAKLLSEGAKIDVNTKFGSGLLEYSIATGKGSIVDELIKAGADVNKKDHFGNTPVFTAALWDKTTIANKLVQAGTDFNVVNNEGFSPLDIASIWDNKQTEEFLKSVGAVRSKNGTGGVAHFGSEEMLEVISEIDSGLFLTFFGKKGRWNTPELEVFFSGEKGILPESQTVTINYEQKKPDSLINNILYRSERPDTGKKISGWVNRNDYFIQLKFAKEVNGVLPGSFVFDYPKANIRLKTEFKAKIKGLCIVDGHPDLQSDSIETLCYAVKLYLEKKHDQKNIEVQQAKGNHSAWHSHEGQGRFQVGGIDVYYEYNGHKEFLRVQLHKKDGIWSVARELRCNQLFAAHPLKEVDKDDTKKYLQLLAYQRLELDLQKEQSDGIFRSGLSATMSRSNMSRSKTMAQVTVRYYVEGDDTEYKRKYLLEFFNNSWQVKRQLAENEKLDTRNDVVETMK